MSESRELTVVEPAEVLPADLMGESPKERLQRARETAELLAPVVRQQGLSVRIQGREHVRFEGWTLLGSLLGVFPVTEWVHEIEGGYEARVVARTLGGQVVGAAHARCTRSEGQWSKRDDFALASMAQTRAGAKALRMPLGFVVQLAGYDATPAEEMEAAYANEPAAPATRREAAAAPSRDGGTQRISDKQRKRLYAIAMNAAERLEVPKDVVERHIKSHLANIGIDSSTELTRVPYDVLCERLERLTLNDLAQTEAPEPEQAEAAF